MNSARSRNEILVAAAKATQQLTSGARLVPVTAGKNVDAEGEVHICRCDRGLAPCPGCVENPPQLHSGASDLSTAKGTR
jgi:hypothetical protein